MPLTFVSDREIEFEFSNDSVKQYSYRTATVCDRFMEMRRDSGMFMDALDKLELALAKAAGVNRDNHTVYEVTMSEDKHLYIMFHDHYVHFGLSVKEGYW